MDNAPQPPHPTTPLPQAWRYWWEDFPVGQVQEFGATLVTREAIIDFARQFDPQPFHLDDEAAKTTLFGGLCASGWHTCAMAMRMMCDEYLLESASLGSPGLDQLRWLKPVFPGDVLRVRHLVADARVMTSKPHVGLIQSKWQVLNQKDETVLTMEGWSMFRRRSHAGGASPVAPAAPTA